MSNKKKKKGFPWGWALVIIIGVLRALTEESDAAFVIGLVVVLAAVALAVSAAKKKAAEKKETVTPRVNRNYTAQQPAAAGRKTPEVELHRPVPSMQRREPVKTAQRSFPQPDAHCVVCDNTGVDHFARDRMLRLRQLDDWLKNGIVDKDEYRVLKARFERDQ